MTTIAFDTETTGLTFHADAPLSLQPRIIEFGCVLLRPDGSTEDEFNVLICPGEQITDEITKITGITNEQLVGQPTFAEALPEIEKRFAAARTVIAHNLAFDRSMMRFELDRIGRAKFPWPAREICTVEATMPDWGRRVKLKDLYAALFGRPLAQKHRALDDAKALAEIVVALELFR